MEARDELDDFGVPVILGDLTQHADWVDDEEERDDA